MSPTHFVSTIRHQHRCCSEIQISAFNNSDCATSKCYYNIDACSFNNTKCAVITTKLNAAKNGLEVSLTHSGSDTWVALGITPTEKMENTDIYYCQNRGTFSTTYFWAFYRPCLVKLHDGDPIDTETFQLSKKYKADLWFSS